MSAQSYIGPSQHAFRRCLYLSIPVVHDGQMEQDFARLGRYIVQRRTELRMTQEDIRASGGPGTLTLRKLEAGKASNYRPMVIAHLEAALGWANGSADRILNGGEPVIVWGAKEWQRGKERIRTLGPGGMNIGPATADEEEDPAQAIRDAVNRSDWNQGTKSALLAIVADAEAELEALQNNEPDVHNSQRAG